MMTPLPVGRGFVVCGTSMKSINARWYALGLITLVVGFNYVDRFLLSILIEPIKRDLHITDTQVGLLTGAAFALFYSILAIPVARLSERVNRVWVLGVSMILWSVATAFCGLAIGFLTLLAARVMVGAGEAGAIPPSHSMTADLFAPHERGVAMSMLGLAGAAGIGIAPLIGGTLEEAVGWRTTFAIVGLPGLLLAAVFLFTVKEPVRGLADGRAAGTPPPLSAVLSRLAKRRAFRALVFGLILMSLGEYSLFLWLPPLFERSYGVSGAELGAKLAIFQGVPFFIASFLGGWLSDRLGRRDPRWQAWVPLLGAASTLPAIIALCFAPSPDLAFWLLILPCFANGFYIAPCYAMIQGLAAVHSRATATAILVFAVNLIGAGIGPLLMGLISDALTQRYGAESLRWAFLSLTPLYAGAVLVFLGVGRSLVAGLKEAADESSTPEALGA
jgi:predicted MFS family arabinose efflux permease